MSASGDYDVSIVESFAPPAKWVPGQAVNKDVYAVNTGNVEAFVKESVTSVMTIVTEDAYKPTADPTKPDADSIELSAGERYVVEAGAFLAYAPLESTYTYDDGEFKGQVVSGRKVIAMNPDFKDEYGYTSADPVTDFKPDAEGLYVFRRMIGVDSKTQLEQYKYDAYYYVPGTGTSQKQVKEPATDPTNPNKYKWQGYDGNGDPIASDYYWTNDQSAPAHATAGCTYKPVMEDVAAVDAKFYKVSDLEVTPVKATFAGNNDDRDGMVAAGWTYNSATGTNTEDSTSAPKYGFYKDVTKTIVPTLTYDKANNRLVASYDTGMAIDKAKLDDLAKKYEDAAIAYEKALEDYAAAIDDQQNDNGNGTNVATDTTLNNASNTLKTKLADLLAAQKAEADAKAAYDKAKAEADALKIARDAAHDEMDAASSALGADDSTDNNTINGRYNNAVTALGQPNSTSANDAFGRENNAKTALGTQSASGSNAADASAWAKYNYANDELSHATQTARQAFLELVAQNEPTVADADAAAPFIASLTYDQIIAKNYANSGDAEYDYYRMVIAEKYAKKALDAAQVAYDTAVQERVAAQNALATALKEKQDAEAALGVGAAASAVYDPVTGQNNTASGRYNYLAKLYKEKMEQCFGITDESNYGVNGSTDDGKFVDSAYTIDGNGNQNGGSLYGSYKAAQANTAAKQGEVDAAQDDYNTALAASNVAAANVKAAADNVAKTKQAKENAWNAYDAAQKADDGKLKININLAEVVTEGGVADKWQLLPESLEDVYKNDINATGVNTITTATDGETDTASFYYTSILGGGETSAKLIDSVELDSSVTKEMFKYFDFDLNVTLNSAQVTFDNDGNYSTDAVIAENGFNKYAFLKDNTSADTAITWSETATATPTKYKATAQSTTNNSAYTDITGGVTITKLAKPVDVGGTYYLYEATSGNDKYYGNSLANEAKYIKATKDATTGVYTEVANNNLKLKEDATVSNT